MNHRESNWWQLQGLIFHYQRIICQYDWLVVVYEIYLKYSWQLMLQNTSIKLESNVNNSEVALQLYLPTNESNFYDSRILGSRRKQFLGAARVAAHRWIFLPREIILYRGILAVPEKKNSKEGQVKIWLYFVSILYSISPWFTSPWPH